MNFTCGAIEAAYTQSRAGLHLAASLSDLSLSLWEYADIESLFLSHLLFRAYSAPRTRAVSFLREKELPAVTLDYALQLTHGYELLEKSSLTIDVSPFNSLIYMKETVEIVRMLFPPISHFRTTSNGPPRRPSTVSSLISISNLPSISLNVGTIDIRLADARVHTDALSLTVQSFSVETSSSRTLLCVPLCGL